MFDMDARPKEVLVDNDKFMKAIVVADAYRRNHPTEDIRKVPDFSFLPQVEGVEQYKLGDAKIKIIPISNEEARSKSLVERFEGNVQ